MIIKPAAQMVQRWIFRRDEPGEDGGGYVADDGPSLSDIADGLDEGEETIESEQDEHDITQDEIDTATEEVEGENEQDEAKPDAATKDDPELDLGAGVKAKASALREALSKATDYTAKTTEVAQRERMAQELVRDTQQRAQAVMQQVQAVMQFVQQDMAQSVPDASLINTNPQEYLRQQVLHQERVSRFQAAAQAGQALQGQQQQTTQAQQAHALQMENARLLEAIPEWKNAQVRASESGKIAAYLTQIGLTPQEMSAMADHRGLLIARDAAKWREYQQLKGKRVPQAKPVPTRVVKPGAPAANVPNNGKAAAVERLRRNPNDERALTGVLPDNF